MGRITRLSPASYDVTLEGENDRLYHFLAALRELPGLKADTLIMDVRWFEATGEFSNIFVG